MNYSLGQYSIKDKKIIKGERGTFNIKPIGLILAFGLISLPIVSYITDDKIIGCYSRIIIASIVIIISIITLLIKIKKDKELNLIFVFTSMIAILAIVWEIQALEMWRNLLQ